MSTGIITSLIWDNVSSIYFDGYGSKIRKANRCRPAVSMETILETRQEFFYKSSPVQSITGIVWLDFWLMLLSGMFTSSYTTIYFYVKKFIFSNVYISVNTMFECFYVFFSWEMDHQLSKYATVRSNNHWGQGDFFCAEVRSLLSKLIFIHFVFCWGRSHEIVEK